MLGGWISQSQHLPSVGPTYMMDHSSSSRQLRNEAEKKRRDTLNGYISELARLVPMVDGTPRRVDKISILRLAATYLMQNQILFTDPSRQPAFLPTLLDSYNLSQNIIEDMDAFMLVVTAAGKIVFVSHTVERLLGHTQLDMFGQSLYNYTLKEDHASLRFNLTSDPDPDAPAPSPVASAALELDETSLTASSDTSSSSALSPMPIAELHPIEHGPPDLQKRSFFVQLSQRSVSRTELPEFKRVHVLGNLRIPRLLGATNKQRAKRQREWPAGEGAGPGVETVLVAMVKLENRIRELSLLEASKDEYVTRHLIDGRIIYTDHRISIVAGYLSEEVNGMSAFKFMHPEDVMFTIVALRQMYDKGEGFGWSCYRLQSATGQFIYLRTHGYLEKNDSTSEVISFICVNTLVDEEAGERLIKEMKARYSASIEASNRIAAEQIEAASPLQIEAGISTLVSQTVVPVTNSVPFPDMQYVKAAMTSKTLPPAHSPTGPLFERASVITTHTRRRRHDSTGSTTSTKRRRADEALTVQVSHEEASEYSPGFSPASTSSMYSPVKQSQIERSRRSTNSPTNFHVDDRGEMSLSPHYRKKELHSPRDEITLNPNHGMYTSIHYSELLLSDQSTYPSEALSPKETTYPYTPLLSSSLRSYHQQEFREAVIVPSATYVNTEDQNQSCYPTEGSPGYAGKMELMSPDEREYVEDTFWEGAGKNEEKADTNPYRLSEMLSAAPEDPEPAMCQLTKLESSLQVQHCQINTMEQEIEQVPRQSQALPLPLYTSLTKLKEEHKKQKRLLKGLTQDLHMTLSERNTNI